MLVTGKVQGVFFRQALKVAAKQNGLSGWVRNLDDGRVEAVIEGEPAKVDVLIKWAHRGPASARVYCVDVHDEVYTGEFPKFEVLY